MSTTDVAQVERLLLRVPEAAAALGISRSKFYELLGTGQIPVVRLGRSVRVPVESLRTWLATQSAR